MKDGTGTTLKAVLNAEFARLLRQHGLEAEAGQSIQCDGRQYQVDVLVELGERVVGINAEFAPARTIHPDAQGCLPEGPKRWRGLPVTAAFRVVYPESFRHLPESRVRDELARCNTLEFQQLSDTGTVVTLADLLRNAR